MQHADDAVLYDRVKVSLAGSRNGAGGFLRSRTIDPAQGQAREASQTPAKTSHFHFSGYLPRL
jgi:hypothetical protein